MIRGGLVVQADSALTEQRTIAVEVAEFHTLMIKLNNPESTVNHSFINNFNIMIKIQHIDHIVSASYTIADLSLYQKGSHE